MTDPKAPREPHGNLAVVVLVLFLVASLSGCKLSPWSASNDNTITTTIEHPDGTKETRVEQVSDDTAYVEAQVKAVDKQKPIFRMEAQPGQQITIAGMKSMEVYTPKNNDIKQYISAAERIFVNGIPLIAMVAQGWINADAMVKIVNSVGAIKNGSTTETYNIATQDGSPVAISKGGNITNGTVSVNKSPTTTTTSSDNYSGTGQ